jgi:Domain of unknown function (DUF4375)
MEIGAMKDAHSAMLDLAIELNTKKATGQRLSTPEQVIVDVTWLDIQIAPNGFLGWLSYTSSERMLKTLAALHTIGCPPVLALVEQALLIATIDPATMSDEDREARLESLSEADARRLFALDNDFYDAVEDCMERLQGFVRAAEASGHRPIE